MNRIQAILADVDGGEGSSSSQQQQPEAPGSPPDDESRVEGIEGLVRSELGGEGLRNFPGISVLDERRRQRESGGAEEGPTATNSALMLSKEEEVKRLTKQMDVLWMQDTERNLPQTKPFTVSGNASNSDSRGGSRAGGSRGGLLRKGRGRGLLAVDRGRGLGRPGGGNGSRSIGRRRGSTRLELNLKWAGAPLGTTLRPLRGLRGILRRMSLRSRRQLRRRLGGGPRKFEAPSQP